MKNLERLLRRATMATVVATGAAILTACTQTASTANPCYDAKVQVGITNSLSDALLYIAQDNGYFDEQGLDVSLKSFKSAGEMIPYLGAGHLSVGAGAPSAGFYNSIDRNTNIKIVADKGGLATGFNYMPMLVRKDLVDSGEITSVKDLKGRSVAEPAPGTATSSTASAVLGSEGLTYDDIEHVYLGFPDHVSALQNGSVDASLTTEPAASTALASGDVVQLADSTEVYNNQQLSVLLYSGDFATEHPEVAQCFMNAYVQAVEDYTNALPTADWNGEGADRIVEIIASHINSTEEKVRSTVPGYVKPDASLNVESLKRDYEFFVQQGMYKGTTDIDFSTLVETSFVNNAAGTAAESE